MNHEQSKPWAGTTYGNGWMHHWLIRILRHIDIRLLYAFVAVFVIPVCLIVNPAQRITYRYFRRRWGMSWWKACINTYRNFYLFAQVVIDKFAMYAGKKFEIDVIGYEHFKTLVGKPDGFLQLSAHVGNYEIAGYTLTSEHKRFNALVFGGEKASVMENRNKMFEGTNIKMIGIRHDMSHLFEINDALVKGEIVSMPADRIFGSQKSLTVSLLGKEALLPSGPFSVATMRSLSVLAVNVMKVSCKAYKIYVTPLQYDNTLPRKQQTQQLAEAYAKELERIIRLYPLQWYNYFDFWNENTY